MTAKKRNPTFMDFIADVLLGTKWYTGKRRYVSPRTLIVFICDECGIEFDPKFRNKFNWLCPDCNIKEVNNEQV